VVLVVETIFGDFSPKNDFLAILTCSNHSETLKMDLMSKIRKVNFISGIFNVHLGLKEVEVKISGGYCRGYF